MTRVKTENPNLERDIHSKALLNSDSKALEAYKKQKKAQRTHEQRLNKLEEDLAEIKALLKKALNGDR